MLSDLNNIIIDDITKKDINIGSILRINNSEFRTVDTIVERDTTNIHDIFEDGSAVATYRLNGDANDLGNRFNGSPVGVVYELNGRYAKQAVFASNRVLIPSVLNFWNVNMSVSVWVSNIINPDNRYNGAILARNHTSANIYQANFGWCLMMTNTFLSFQRSYNGTTLADITFNHNIKDTLPHLVSISFNRMNGYVSFYIDGILVENRIISGYSNNVIYSSYDGGVNIGQTYLPGYPEASTHNPLYANLSQMRIFNRVLTQEEVLKLYAERRYVIPMMPPLSALPSLVETVSSEVIASSDTYYKDLLDDSYDSLEDLSSTTKAYLIDDKVKNKSNDVIYKCIKPNTIGVSLTDTEYFTPVSGILLKNNVLAHSNGKDDKNYSITDIESVDDVIINPNTIVNGYKYVAKYKDSNDIVLEDREPIFTGFYEMCHSKDSRLVLVDNKWCRNNTIPDSNSFILNHTFNKPESSLSNWKILSRTSNTTPWVIDNPIASITPLGAKVSFTLSGSRINGAIETSINILRKGWYTIEIDMADVVTDSVRVRAASTPIEGWNGNGDVATIIPDIIELGKHDISTIYTLKVWLTEGVNYIAIVTQGIGTQLGRYATVKSCKVFDSNEFLSSNNNQTKISAISFLGRYLFRDSKPIEKDSRWTPPKVMQEDTLINGKLITTGNRVWKEIGTVYLNQRLVIKNPFGNENWKDTDVKAYIWHPITKRWESSINLHYRTSFSTGLFFSATEEGIVLVSASGYLYENDNTLFGGSAPFLTNSEADITISKISLIITYIGETKKV